MSTRENTITKNITGAYNMQVINSALVIPRPQVLTSVPDFFEARYLHDKSPANSFQVWMLSFVEKCGKRENLGSFIHLFWKSYIKEKNRNFFYRKIKLCAHECVDCFHNYISVSGYTYSTSVGIFWKSEYVMRKQCSLSIRLINSAKGYSMLMHCYFYSHRTRVTLHTLWRKGSRILHAEPQPWL